MRVIVNKILMTVGFVLMFLGGSCLESDGKAFIIAVVMTIVGLVMLYLGSREMENYE